MSIVRRTRDTFDPKSVDWARVDATTDDEIDEQVARDPDTAPPLRADLLSSATRVFPAPSPMEIRAMRERLGLTQSAFAARFGISVETVRNYEQGHRTPTGPVRVLLRVIAREPDAVVRALGPG
jgi:putative transcriptional regulator